MSGRRHTPPDEGTAADEPPGEAYESLARTLGQMVRQARKRSRHAAQAIDPELDPSSYPLLVHLYQHPDTRVSDLAQAHCVSKGTMSRQLARLDRLGIVKRQVDATDSRGQLIRLTESARASVGQAKQAQSQLLREALSAWPDGDVVQLERLLQRLIDDLP